MDDTGFRRRPANLRPWLAAGLALAAAAVSCNTLMAQFATAPAPGTRGHDLEHPTPTATPAPSATATATPPAATATPAAYDWSYDYTPAPAYDDVEWAIASGWFTEGQLAPPANKPLNWKVGDTRSLKYSDDSGDRTIKARVRYITEHFIMLFEPGVQAGEAEIARAAEQAEQEIYPTVRRIFGEEWSPGVDGDPHVLVLHLSRLSGDNYGEFSPEDECPVRLCDFSNGHEMIYLTVDGLQVGSDEYLGVLAHEFQHAVRYHTDGADSNWLNEALAVLAETLTGHGQLAADFVPDFFADPDMQLNQWPARHADNGPNYGAGYLFALYLYEAFGEAFIHDLAREPRADMAGVAAALPAYTGEPLSQVFGEWTVANLLDDPGLAGQPGASDASRYGYVHEALPDLALIGDGFQSPAGARASVHQFAADYVSLQPAGGLHLTFDGAVETPLLPVGAHSGRRFWWSNRLDNSRASLQTALDLSGLSHPRASFWMWYDTEPDRDVVTVEVSTDDGGTWTVAKGGHSEADDWWSYRYAGVSGGGASAEWVRETVDLEAWKGRKIRLRLEYLSDAAHTGPGFALDDFALDSDAGRGPVQDFEAGAQGWTAAGFVYAGSTVRQDWRVYLVTRGSAPQVRPLAVDAAGHAEIDVPASAERPVLVVAASAPFTEELAAYSYRVEARP